MPDVVRFKDDAVLPAPFTDLKDQYAYLLCNKYIVPFENTTDEEIAETEKTIINFYDSVSVKFDAVCQEVKDFLSTGTEDPNDQHNIIFQYEDVETVRNRLNAITFDTFDEFKRYFIGVINNVFPIDASQYPFSVSDEDVKAIQEETFNHDPQTYTHMNGLVENRDYLVLTPDIISAIDMSPTERANTTKQWRELNELYRTFEFTLAEVRRFRTFVAEQLLKLPLALEDFFGKDTRELELVTRMLEYYKNEMNDCTLSSLMLVDRFAVDTIAVSATICGCGCTGSSATTSMYGNQARSIAIPNVMMKCSCGPTSNPDCDIINVANCLNLYRMAMYNIMVSVFSNTDFWIYIHDYANGVLTDDLTYIIKRFIDEIIRRDMPLAPAVPDWYSYCKCGEADTEQGRLMSILCRLSRALEYIYTDKYINNRNFINSALFDWARALYQTMRW